MEKLFRLSNIIFNSSWHLLWMHYFKSYLMCFIYYQSLSKRTYAKKLNCNFHWPDEIIKRVLMLSGQTILYLLIWNIKYLLYTPLSMDSILSYFTMHCWNQFLCTLLLFNSIIYFTSFPFSVNSGLKLLYWAWIIYVNRNCLRIPRCLRKLICVSCIHNPLVIQ